MRRATRTPFIDRDGIQTHVDAFRGTADPRDPALSPLLADVTGLPRGAVFCRHDRHLPHDSLFTHMRWPAAGNRSEPPLHPAASMASTP
jgi:hypothetical protein